MNVLQAKQLLKSRRIKATTNRVELLLILDKQSVPVSIPELVKLCDQLSSKPDQATVYRTIEHFYQSKLVYRLDFHEGMYRYELATRSHHHHLYCNHCGSIAPIYNQCLSISDQTIQKEHGFAVTNHSLEFFGICRNCQS